MVEEIQHRNFKIRTFTENPRKARRKSPKEKGDVISLSKDLGEHHTFSHVTRVTYMEPKNLPFPTKFTKVTNKFGI